MGTNNNIARKYLCPVWVPTEKINRVVLLYPSWRFKYYYKQNVVCCSSDMTSKRIDIAEIAIFYESVFDCVCVLCLCLWENVWRVGISQFTQ